MADLSRSGWTANADNWYTGSPGYTPAAAIDGDTSTFWSSTGGYPISIWVDMGSAQTFNYIKYWPRHDGTLDSPSEILIYVSDDGSNWGDPISYKVGPNDNTERTITFPTQNKRWFKCYCRSKTSGSRNFGSCADLNAGYNAGYVADTHSQLYGSNDTSTLGDWPGVYGTAGYNVANDTSSYPSGTTASVTATGLTHTWLGEAPISNPYWIKKASDNSTRTNYAWYTDNPSYMEVDITNTSQYQVSFYCMSPDDDSRAMKMYLMETQADGSLWITGYRALSSMTSAPKWVKTLINGTVKIRWEWTVGINGTIIFSGIMFDPPNVNIGESLNNWSDSQTIGYPVTQFAKTDNLNNWGDAQSSLLNAFITKADSMALSDSTSSLYSIWQVALSKTVSDSFIINTGPNKYSWKDGLTTDSRPDNNFNLGLDDLSSNLKDDINVSMPTFFNSQEVEAFDSMMYNLLDSIDLKAIVSNLISDGLAFNDAIQLIFGSRITKSDNLTLSDFINAAPNGLPSFNDSLYMADNLAISMNSAAIIAISDSMTMDDNIINPTFGTAFLSYIRRYLNDTR